MLCFRNICQRTLTVITSAAYMPARDIHISTAMCGEPMKKKKRMDPALVRMQTDRRKRRIEKQIRQQLRFARKLKPIDDYELYREVSKDAEPRNAVGDTISTEEKLRRRDLIREWTLYKAEEWCEMRLKFSGMIKAQEKALTELKIASPEKYELAVTKVLDLLPYSYMGPCETPPVDGYVQDGKYTETTKSYELNPEIVKLMLDKNAKANKKDKSASRRAAKD